ncbi:MAG: S24/S26 family peptidase [Bacteroidaceae bacterium]|nr:S24/S26 family peptidase [Bacteroidaceae bacterium]MBR2863845.1 S24/S26 family peptidase [Bacteroidaceae bacterium]
MKSIALPNAILIPEIKKAIDEGHTATFRVRGFSMRLFLEDRRDKVVLAPYKEVKVGDVVLAEIKKDIYVLHRVIKKEGEHLTLMGDGNIYGTEKCLCSNVIGVVTAFYRKGREKADLVEGKKWRIYSFCWLKLKPIRRYILAFYRHIWLRLFPVHITD